jgi:hypothetical protein
MRQQDDAGCRDEAAESPGDRRRLRIGPRNGRRDRAHMHGMAGRKSIVGVARTGNATAAPMDHASIRPFLVAKTLLATFERSHFDAAPREFRPTVA